MISMKAARVNKNMTQQQIADKMGVHVQTYAKMEKDSDNMTIAEAKQFAEIVGMALSDVFFGKDSN